MNQDGIDQNAIDGMADQYGNGDAEGSDEEKKGDYNNNDEEYQGGEDENGGEQAEEQGEAPQDGEGEDMQNYQMHQSQNTDNVEDKISEELEEKIKALDDYVKGKNEEQILNIRMHQLALAKILVFTHGKSHFRLVKAHTNLGEAYLNYKCHEQAIDHLTIALKKNTKLFNQIKDSKQYNADILTLLGKTYLEIGSYDDALDLLNQAFEIQSSIYGPDDAVSAPTLTLISNCYTKMKEYDKALEEINKVWDICQAQYGGKSEQCAIAFVESAQINALKEDYKTAISFQNRAIDQLIEMAYDKPEYVAELYSQLGSYQDKINDVDGYIESLSQVRTIYQQIYGQVDKRVIQVKRQLSIVYLKNQQHEEALNELYQTEELENKVYGDNSVQVAKSQRVIGTILIFLQQFFDAQRYLTKALKIFEQNGLQKAVNEVKQKLKVCKEMREKGKVTKGSLNFDNDLN